ncbi:helix-turn-helix transcriptional regulator [Streptomyces sp. SID3343]|uniref:helix-turn-helix domain-containing protein n=1 Tax=Streptomyces sp. SID3343 TaxID=2690260 RepID=UPI001367A51B|nr:helix-turn-helix transcriptional regulator [Streptomyces sp. SID3343]MYW05396.1 helix-turn-helix domain-containing protein [Streptomyces sp. SID3343]
MPAMRQRRRLGIELRTLRLDAGYTVDGVADALGWSKSKVSRIETSRVALTRHDLYRLCGLYDVKDGESQALQDLHAGSDDHRWWLEYGDVVGSVLEDYISLEAQASEIAVANGGLIPGLLQCREYAEAITPPNPNEPESAEGIVEVRLRRRAAITGENPADLTAVIGPSAFYLETGGRDVLKAQLKHFLDLAELPTVDIWAIPDKATDAAFSGGVTIFDFADVRDPSVAYVEYSGGMLSKDKPREVRRYRRLLRHLADQALPPDETKTFITQRLEEL